ncbi:hypothetical protein AB205_0092370 [Aquarana catesbeiana]|uniref:Uncharacterized protein n=1 Tax=Aquarana catesbeiana TaxID=8400 RepID=A0A2G9QC40_AQUCT|nr:hypothetical protein AB205_0092370 [Aquarana catesbeiana]
MDTRGLSICETLITTKGKYSSFRKGKKNMFQLGTLPKQTIVRHFQAMFHIPISCLKYLCAKYTLFFLHIEDKRLGATEDTKNTKPPKEGEIHTYPEEDVEGELQELGEIVTTTGDAVDVVEEETHFTSASAHILIGEIIVCNRELEKIKENINDIEKRLNNITDVFKQNIKHPNIFTFCHYIFYFQKVLK